MILGLKTFRPHWPGLLIAVGLAAAAAALFGLPVTTIGSQFGGIPSSLPAPELPTLTGGKILAVLPAAVSFTLLGAIESLLSAVVADGMTGRRHRSNCELMAQGIANIGSALLGGFCVTGTIARTATNVRSGAHGPVSGMLHSAFLLLFMLVAAPLAAYIPLAALAGVLAVVAWNMVEKQAIAVLLRSGWGEAAVLTVTFLLTVFRDLTEAIVVGFALGSVLFIQRISRVTTVRSHNPNLKPLVASDIPDSALPRKDYDETQSSDPETVIYPINGALFFGATASIGTVLDRISDSYKTFVIDFEDVSFLDSTGANMIEGLVQKPIGVESKFGSQERAAPRDACYYNTAYGVRCAGMHRLSLTRCNAKDGSFAQVTIISFCAFNIITTTALMINMDRISSIISLHSMTPISI